MVKIFTPVQAQSQKACTDPEKAWLPSQTDELEICL